MEPFTVLLAQSSDTFTSTTPTIDPSAATGIVVAFLIFELIFFIAGFVLFIFHMISLYSWGTTDAKYFVNGKTSKSNWFWVLNLVPFGSTVYFFKTRKQVAAAERADRQNSQGYANNQGYSQPPMYNQQPNPYNQPPQAPQPPQGYPQTPNQGM